MSWATTPSGSSHVNHLLTGPNLWRVEKWTCFSTECCPRKLCGLILGTTLEIEQCHDVKQEKYKIIDNPIPYNQIEKRLYWLH